ncbi:MAG: hypothetical protein J7K83_01065, partial [Candidatus Aenigmarchaeota archaeon]|nr:hypothetical protein [Candidatus Aenigmarchaeota archaeon]
MAEKRLAERVDDLEESFLVLSGLYAELRKYIEKIDQKLSNISGIDEERVKTLIKATMDEKLDEIKNELKIELLPNTQPFNVDGKLKVLEDEIIALKTKLVDKEELTSYIDKKFDETIADTREKMDTVLTTIQSMRREIADIPKNVYEIVDKVSSTVENIKKEMGDLRSFHNELSNKLTEINESIEKNKDKIYKHDEEIAELNEKLSDLSKLYDEIKLLNEKTESLSNSIENVRSVLMNEISSIKQINKRKVQKIVKDIISEYN